MALILKLRLMESLNLLALPLVFELVLFLYRHSVLDRPDRVQTQSIHIPSSPKQHLPIETIPIQKQHQKTSDPINLNFNIEAISKEL
jgi:hypothetical protein